MINPCTAQSWHASAAAGWHLHFLFHDFYCSDGRRGAACEWWLLPQHAPAWQRCIARDVLRSGGQQAK